jgi:hypothetical protein
LRTYQKSIAKIASIEEKVEQAKTPKKNKIKNEDLSAYGLSNFEQQQIEKKKPG